MSALDSVPTNTNFLSPLGYAFIIRRAPAVKFFLQRVNVPGISSSPAVVSTPLTDIPYNADQLQWDDLSVTFKVDEQLVNYREIFTWLQGMTFPENTDQYKALADQQTLGGNGLVSDLTIMSLTSSKNPSIAINFKWAFPYALSSIDLNSTDTDVNFVTATALFKYTSYTIDTL